MLSDCSATKRTNTFCCQTVRLPKDQYLLLSDCSATQSTNNYFVLRLSCYPKDQHLLFLSSAAQRTSIFCSQTIMLPTGLAPFVFKLFCDQKDQYFFVLKLFCYLKHQYLLFSNCSAIQGTSTFCFQTVLLSKELAPFVLKLFCYPRN